MDSTNGEPLEPGDVVGANLRRLREARHLSLGQLARDTGLSKAMIASLERGGGNPTIATIWKLARGLEVPYTELIDPVDERATVRRGADAIRMSHEDSPFQVLGYFAETDRRDFDLFGATLEAGARDDSPGHGADCREYLLVCAGALTVTETGGGQAVEHELACGDAIEFDASGPHAYENRGEEPARFVIVNQRTRR